MQEPTSVYGMDLISWLENKWVDLLCFYRFFEDIL